MLNLNLKKAAIFAVLATLVVSGSAFGQQRRGGRSTVVRPGTEVVVGNGDEVVVDTREPQPAKKPAANSSPGVMVDDYNSSDSAASLPEDTSSAVELSIRGILTPGVGPALGGTLGFAWMPANRYRFYAGFNGSKGLIDLKGSEKESFQFGLTLAGTYSVTRTVELGFWGNISWAYRDLTKDLSASFIGVGPGFRINKWSHVFFEASLPIGGAQKFSGDWSLLIDAVASAGVRF